jgi:hypothetical protein
LEGFQTNSQIANTSIGVAIVAANWKLSILLPPWRFPQLADAITSFGLFYRLAFGRSAAGHASVQFNSQAAKQETQ